MKPRTYNEGKKDGYEMGAKIADKWIFRFTFIGFIGGCMVGYMAGVTL